MKITCLDHIHPSVFQSTAHLKSKFLPICAIISLVTAVCFCGYRIFQFFTKTKGLKNKKIKSLKTISPKINNPSKKENPNQVEQAFHTPIPSLFSHKTYIPTVIANHILSFLGFEDIRKCPLIANSWYASETVWKNIANQLQVPKDLTISYKKQVTQCCHYDFGIYNPKTHKFITTKKVSIDDLLKIIKNFPNTRLIEIDGFLDSFVTYYNKNGKIDKIDSIDALTNLNGEKNLLDEVQNSCTRIFITTSTFQPEFDTDLSPASIKKRFNITLLQSEVLWRSQPSSLHLLH